MSDEGFLGWVIIMSVVAFLVVSNINNYSMRSALDGHFDVVDINGESTLVLKKPFLKVETPATATKYTTATIEAIKIEAGK